MSHELRPKRRDIRSHRSVFGIILACAILLAVYASIGDISQRSASATTQAGKLAPHELIAQSGGTSQVMRLDGDRLWTGLGPRLVAMDVSDAGEPRMLGRTEVLSGTLQDLAFGALEPNAAGAESNTAWALVTGDRVVGIDIANPAAPALLGAVELLTRTVGIARIDDHVWAATREGDLIGIDVSDPNRPRLAARLDGLARRADVRHIGAIPGYVVVATRGYGSPPMPVLHQVDVRDPANPAEAGRLANPGPAESTVNDAVVSGGLVWLLTGSSPYVLYAVDPSPADAPQIIGQLELPSSVVAFGHRLVVAGDRAYIMGGDYGHNFIEMSVLDVQDPAAIRPLASRIALPRSSDPSGGIAADGQRLWYGSDDGRLFGLDARDPEALAPAAVVQTIGRSQTLAVEAGRGLLGLLETTLSVDLTAPRAPQVLTQTMAHWYPQQIAWAEDRAYVLTDGEMDVLGGSLHRLNIADLARPQVEEILFRGDFPRRIALAGPIAAMVASRPSGEFFDQQIATLDLTAPASQSRIGELVDPAGFQDVAIDGDRLYAASPTRYGIDPQPMALVVGDISDPASPEARGRIELGGPFGQRSLLRLAIDGDMAFVLAIGYTRADTIAYNALHVVDASDPARPVEIARLPLDRLSSAITLAHDHLFLSGEGGVSVFDVRDPARPAALGILPTGADPATEAVVDQGLVYATAGDAGLFVFAPQLEGWPTVAVPTSPPPSATSVASVTPSPTGSVATPTATRYGEVEDLYLPWVGRGN